MRKLFSMLTIFSLIFSISLFSEHAEAKKFGGGKSFGQSFKTAPSQPAHTINTVNPTINKQIQPNKSGLMGGLLGGLLAGGLFAWLLGSGAFSGLHMLDILLIAGIAFFIIRFLRNKKSTTAPGSQPAYNMPYQARQPVEPVSQESGNAGSSSITTDAVPFDLPAGFDISAFIKEANDHYKTLQTAWNVNDFSKIQEYVTPDLFNVLKQERAEYPGEQHTEVLYLNSELVRADRRASSAQLSVLFKGRYRDVVEGIEEDINEIWHLERDIKANNASWIIVGIENK